MWKAPLLKRMFLFIMHKNKGVFFKNAVFEQQIRIFIFGWRGIYRCETQGWITRFFIFTFFVSNHILLQNGKRRCGIENLQVSAWVFIYNLWSRLAIVLLASALRPCLPSCDYYNGNGTLALEKVKLFRFLKTNRFASKSHVGTFW